MIILDVLAWATGIILAIIGILAIGVYMLVKDIADSVDYIKNHVLFIANLVPNPNKVEHDVAHIKDDLSIEIEMIEEDISNLYLRIRDLEEKKND